MKGKLSLRRKAIRITLWLLGAGVVSFIGSQIFISQYLPSLIRNRITYLVVNGSDSLYKCSIGDVSVNLIGGGIEINDLDISVDTARFKYLESTGRLPDITFSAKMTGGKISGFKILPFLLHKKVRIHTIKAEHSDIIIHSQYNPQKEEVRKKMRDLERIRCEAQGIPDRPISEQKLWKLIEPEMEGIFVKWIFLDHMRFSYQKAGATNVMKVEYDDLSASLREVRIDSTGASEKERILFTEDLSLSFKGLKYYSEDSLYMMHMDSMIYSSYAKNIFVRGFGVGPRLKPIEFMRKVGQQVDVFEVKVDEINIFNFQIDKIFTQNAIVVDTVVAEKPLLKIYHDRTFPPDTVVKYGQYPNEALLRMPLNVRVPVVVLSEAEVHYIEKQAVTFQTGDVFFTHINGTVTNFTNDSICLKKDNHMRVDMEGNFLHSGKMKAEFDFDLASENGYFTAKADLGRMGAKELSLMTVPFGNIRINTTNLHEAHFFLKGTRNGTVGTLKMIYDDLSVEILKKDLEKPGMKKDKFMSFIANLAGIRKSNPSESGKETVAENIIVVRTPVMPFFNMIWKTLFGGMKDVMLRGPAKKIKIGQEE